ncbi:MAG TPA: hypothetical protein VJQ57_14080 [Acidimicrobiia bacterium]|nr:hypothetical protein [Acidimicrobiia bacterium]
MKAKVLIAFGLVLIAACGQGGGGEPVGGTIEVTARDYEFEGIPELVASGAEFTLTNASAAEVHEMIVIGIPGDETRTLEELLELPEEETADFPFQGVLVALPGEDGGNPEGAGNTISVTEPGRYAVVCFIPQGADPAVVEEAMAGGGEGPPDMGEGTPHAFLGMAAEFTVEG